MKAASQPPLSRREFIGASALATSAVALAPQAGAQRRAKPAPTKPNIVFIHTDQQSLSAMSAHGCEHVYAPNMDRLAARGMSFQMSYSANPVCCPARSCWYTGRTSAETGVVRNSWPIDETMPDLGQWFNGNGYEAVYAGKWHVPGRNFRNSFRVISPGTGIGEHSDGASSRATEAFLHSYSGDKPFFLSLGLLQPHDICYWVFEHVPRLEELPYPQIADELPPLPDNFEYDPREPETFIKHWRQRGKTFRDNWSETQWRYYQWAYFRSVEMADAEIGRVLDAVEDSGHADDTLIIFTADHGDGHARHQMISKMYMYDEAAAVPFVAAFPGQMGEGIMDSDHLVSGLDV
ncbi:MAG TPA: sulfatase-like hydrolase/transferase, partial [Armatimonadota bacterium]|nr:sulfatase-like hydrolase/transferase [Armatimonadota bacterium]